MKRDFQHLHDPPRVIVSKANSFGHLSDEEGSNPADDIRFLANLLKHANVVIHSGGSLVLDAVTFNTPVIYIGFDGDLQLPEVDRWIVRYELEHIRPVIDSEGIWLVGNYDELDRAINGYLANPGLHDQGRKRIRGDHLEPLDGRASERLVDIIVRFAEGIVKSVEKDGYREHRGIEHCNRNRAGKRAVMNV